MFVRCVYKPKRVHFDVCKCLNGELRKSTGASSLFEGGSLLILRKGTGGRFLYININIHLPFD